jgi:hypothetical protein
LDSHKTLNRAHLGSFPNDDVSSDGMHYICRVFDVSVMVWSAAEKYTLVAAKLYGDWYPDSQGNRKYEYHE